MTDDVTPATESQGNDPDGFQVHAPSISLPKGGGAIRGIGEKFAANPVTGTGSMTVPIALSPGRSGFGPQLSLAYDSGAGNGPFGFGWNLSLPAITRKTDKGLPKYLDTDASDEFILSGAEDLVPVLVNQNGVWQPEDLPPRTVNGNAYTIQRYRPRIQGLFARIERWTNQNDAQDTFWRSISRDNITTWYGKTENSRIADPDDKTRIFSWLICQSNDDKGNIIVYEYKPEDSANVDLSQVHEKNRTIQSRTANRYLKHIRYGNHTPYFPELLADQPWPQPPDGWFFEVVFDYGEHDSVAPTLNNPGSWSYRNDPFSSYRAGFEVRTYRLCQRVLMFHHFPDELGLDDYLVRSTEFTYEQSPIASFVTSVTQSGFKYNEEDGTFLKKSLPPLEFSYSQAIIQQETQEVDSESIENLPNGLDGSHYQWVDLDGEGLSGILTEQAGAWFYKPNQGNGRFGPVETVAAKPSLALIGAGGQQLLDLAGDGQLDLVEFNDPTPGFYERTHDQDWHNFRPFTQLPNIAWDDPNLRFVDLNGDGHADILITEDELFTWYPSLAEEGFGQAEKLCQALYEEQGPRLVFSDGTQSVYLADLSGDGLSDLCRIRNGDVCYWPNLGYGRFGAKVTMGNAPWFDAPDQFNQRRIRTADIDGSGTTDIIYLGRHKITIYRNQCGNRWDDPETLENFPLVDNFSTVIVADLLGNGTACLVWSSPLPGDAPQPLKYIDLMGGQKPHLLETVQNNLGAETKVHYTASTRFYLADKAAGKPWITKIPFPVHVVERVETCDHISRNRFVTRYAYHHGYFDGIEREFRGFGLVEQWDTEAFAALEADGLLDDTDNWDEASHVPPVLTKTWFHTGAYGQGQRISRQYEDAYYHEPGQTGPQAKAMLLPDTILPNGLTAEGEREACRALKGAMLRQEVYAPDSTDKAPHPYTVVEQNFTIRCLQPRQTNRHGVFFTHAREAITYHYERNPADPRTAHALTLEVDDFGNVLKAASIGYGRHHTIRTVDENGVCHEIPNPGLEALDLDDRIKQTQTLVTYTENAVTNVIETADDHRTPLACETRTYELTGYTPTGDVGRFQFSDFVQPDPMEPDGRRQIHVFDDEIAYEDTSSGGRQRRGIEHVLTLYRADDLSGPLPLGQLHPLALPYESYKLALTPDLIAQIYRRTRDGVEENLLPPDPNDILGVEGGYVHSEGDGNWWQPSGKAYLAPDLPHEPGAEWSYARAHFFLPHRFEDPFGNSTVIAYDTAPDGREYNLLVTAMVDPIGNQIRTEHDYRVLQPRLIIDPNRNHSEVVFDTLGMVAGTAVKGKVDEAGQSENGDSLEGFVSDLTDELPAFMAAPRAEAGALLSNATARIVYDLDSYMNLGQPVFAATIAREKHVDDVDGGASPVQVSFSYSDGFGRAIQKKIQAEPGPIVEGEPDSDPRWVGSGWAIFNNKGKPVRQYEPFFSDTHGFEFAHIVGVSPILFYDPLGRVMATLHPNHTYEKVVFDPWQQTTWDVNDTVLGDPRADAHIKSDTAAYFAEYFETQPQDWETWYAQRIEGTLGEQERAAAIKAACHAETPSKVHLDTLGRPFLTVAHNRVDWHHPDREITEAYHRTRVELDVEGNQLTVKDERNIEPDPEKEINLEQRDVMRYDYSIAGPEEDENGEPTNTHLIHQASMEAGERWVLNDVSGQPIRAWDSRGHTIRTEYDALRRPLRIFVTSAEPDLPDEEMLTERLVYGEMHAEAQNRNLRGQLHLHLDQAGAATNEAFDFKDNPLRTNRRLAADYKGVVDWNPVDQDALDDLKTSIVPLLEPETFTAETAYDALNRPVTLSTPHSEDMLPSIIRPGYNEANLLETIEANLRGTIEDGELAWTSFVANIDYDAKGQRSEIVYGNGVRTTYDYDPETFRLIHLRTLRGSDRLQDLFYTYDPVGNITHIQDDAQQTIYFDNVKVPPHADYVYDAIYRIIQAKGREHRGQVAHHTPHDTGRTGLPHPNNGQSITAYTERYLYDYVGNILQMQHGYNNNSNGGWTRHDNYSEVSLLEDTKFSNRLSSTTISNGQNPEIHTYDAHGNMTQMNHLDIMQWDYRDQLEKTARQVVNHGQSPEATYYVYDAGGQRVRKVTENSTGLLKNERIYLGGFEIFRKYTNDDSSPTLERETLHIMDNKERIALVETHTQGSESNISEQFVRYQLGNQLGSASLEVDDNRQLISYEEYFPYGSTSYQGVRNDIQVPRKRYRYTGKERDEETGFNYHEARYYIAWLKRWLSCDPVSIQATNNLYRYSSNNPVSRLDPKGTADYSSSICNLPSKPDESKIKIEGSIRLIEESPFGKTREGKNIISKLRSLNRGSKIVYEASTKNKGWTDGDKIFVNTDYENNFFKTIPTLVHEASHLLWPKNNFRDNQGNVDKQKWFKDYVADELRAWENELIIYKYLRETYDGPKDVDLELRLGWKAGGILKKKVEEYVKDNMKRRSDIND